MKKNIFKKALVAITATLMMAATTIPVSAAGYTITINNDSDSHTYQAYQIFAGDVDSNGVLTNITWGTGVNAAGQTALGNAADKAATLTDTAAAKDFAAAVAPYLATAAAEDDYTDSAYKLSVTDAGYYLIVDKPESLNGTDESYTSYILKVVGDVTAEPKSDVPTVVKKVKDKNDTSDTTSEWQDSADYDIGDVIPFEITVNLPSNFEDYTKYDLVVTDVISTGLTYNNDAVITVDGTVFNSCTVDTSTAGKVIFSMTNDVLVGVASNNSVIKINYTAKLNENAVIGSAGNPNTVSATYSNNPNSEMTGSSDDTGTTPEDKVVIFTYDLVINKVNGEGAALAGAAFTLYKKNSTGGWDVVEAKTAGAATSFTFSGLDDGDYKLVETTTPAGYNEIQPIEFTISATHETSSDNPQLTALSATQLSATANLANGTLTAEIENNAGSSLPTTGGVGTTIFFVSGGILVAAAGIILIIKKRMNDAE